jgi:hypothetical protein
MGYIGKRPTDVPLDATDIPNLDTAKVTTGTFADARISAGSVTQHVAATDLVPLKQDIATLALHSAIADNKTAYNLPNFFIDQFEDDTGILTETDGDRNASEYWSPSAWGSSAVLTGEADASFTGVGDGDFTTANSGSTNIHDGNIATSGFHWNPSSNGIEAYGSANPDGLRYDMTELRQLTKVSWYHIASYSRFKSWSLYTSSDASTWTVVADMTGSDGSTGSSTHTLVASNVNEWQTGTLGTAVTCRYYRIIFHTNIYQGGNDACYMTELLTYAASLTVNATGTLISNAQTASSATTKLSGVFLYKDNAGTATLGTDLKIYLSANNGTNFTEIPSYGTVSPLFSTGIKMIRMPETTVTSGTSIKLKAVWANQSSGSKETFLYGWAVNY